MISVIVHEKDGQLILVFAFVYLFFIIYLLDLINCEHNMRGYVCSCVVYCMKSRDQHHASTLFLCGCWGSEPALQVCAANTLFWHTLTHF